MSVESDQLSMKSLVLTVFEPFGMVTGITCTKLCVLTEWEIAVACSIVLKGLW